MVKESNVDDLVFEMVSGCTNGNKCHQTKFYTKFNKVVYSTCLKYIGNSQEAEDITQEVFIKLFNILHKFNGKNEKQLYSWIKMVSRNMTIDIIRKNKNKSVDINYENLPDLFETPNFDETNDEQNNLDNDIKNAINKLSPKYKKVFELYYLDNYTHEEISNKLNLNVGTSKSNLFKARKKMSEILKKYNNKF
jgi:RNA polymerase sigma-70 factor (ECF subfamily)